MEECEDMRTKKLTFSFDDGVWQDARLLEILNRYNLKATFNLNSARFGESGTLCAHGKTISYRRFRAEDIPQIYRGHEIGAHTMTHRNLTQLSDEQVISEVESDRLALSALCGYEVLGMAYPCGGTNYTAHVVNLIQTYTGIRYARTITASGSFAFPKDLFRLNPTVRMTDFARLHALFDQFLSLPASEPAVFSIWGHSFDLDFFEAWDLFEEFCRKAADCGAVTSCTNSEAFFATTKIFSYKRRKSCATKSEGKFFEKSLVQKPSEYG